MRIDLHNHTVYSKHWFWGIDALNTPEEMIKAAIKRGLDGIAITDHNYVKSSLKAKQQARRIDKDFLVVTGTEIRSEAGDVLALGVKEDVEPGLSVEETARVLKVSPKTVMRDWRLAKSWLLQELDGRTGYDA